MFKIYSRAITLHVFPYSYNMKDVAFSRVYTIAKNKEWKIWLIFNSKKNIRGFPWGHTEKWESISDTANREYIEEIRYSLSTCSPKYVIEYESEKNVTKERHLICFGTVWEKSNKYSEENEAVTKIWFFSTDEALKKIWNSELWINIFEDFNHYSAVSIK